MSDKCPGCDNPLKLIYYLEAGRSFICKNPNCWYNGRQETPPMDRDNEDEWIRKAIAERGMVMIPKSEYEELKEKAGKWDVSQLMTMQMLYGEKAFDLSNAKWDEPTEKELVTTVMKALTGSIKNGAIKIERKENEG